MLPRPATPAGAWRDLRAFFATRERHQIVFALLACMMPVLFTIGFYLDSRTDPPPPRVVYVENFNGRRSDDVIVARQKLEKAEKDRLIAERKAVFQKLEKRLGIE